jgi:hypothetical protein
MVEKIAIVSVGAIGADNLVYGVGFALDLGF